MWRMSSRVSFGTSLRLSWVMSLGIFTQVVVGDVCVVLGRRLRGWLWGCVCKLLGTCSGETIRGCLCVSLADVFGDVFDWDDDVFGRSVGGFLRAVSFERCLWGCLVVVFRDVFAVRWWHLLRFVVIAGIFGACLGRVLESVSGKLLWWIVFGGRRCFFEGGGDFSLDNVFGHIFEDILRRVFRNVSGMSLRLSLGLFWGTCWKVFGYAFGHVFANALFVRI